MLRTRERQGSFYDADFICEQLIPEDSFYRKFREVVTPLISDKDFEGIYCTDNGRPAISPALLAMATILQFYKALSDREMERACMYDIEVKDARTNTITFSYNQSGLVNAVTDQLGDSESYAYDLSDNMTSFTDRKGQSFSFEYDYLDRIVNAVSPGTGNHTTYAYDAASRLTDVDEYANSSLVNSISIGYTNGSSGDKFEDRVKTVTTDYGGLTNTISYDYDELGRRTRMQITGQSIEVFYTYDALNLTNIEVTNTTSGDLDFALSYDTLGLRNSVSFPNGVTTEYQYYPTGAVYSIAVSNSTGTLESLIYTYDTSGNRKSMTRDGLDTKFPTGFSNTPVYNAANRLTSFNGDTVLYDDNGNMTSWGDATFTWDSRNRLTAINGTSLSASFKYDSMGRRIEKTINGTTTKYLYDGADIVMEMNGSGTPTAFYVRTLNIDEPLARIYLSSGEIRYYHADALGSIIALMDENATVVTQYNYSPFGQTEVIGTDSTGLSQPFRYTGREWDGDTGLYFYRARYYSPEMARFISEDPIGLAGGINQYAYVGNAPLDFVDAFGLAEGDPEGNGGTAPVSPPDPSEYPLYPGNWNPNPNGIICSSVCGLGTKLMCFGLSGGAGLGTGGVGSSILLPCNIATTYACAKICPPILTPREPEMCEDKADK